MGKTSEKATAKRKRNLKVQLLDVPRFTDPFLLLRKTQEGEIMRVLIPAPKDKRQTWQRKDCEKNPRKEQIFQ